MRFRRLFLKACMVAIILGVCAVTVALALGEIILELLYTVEYGSYKRLLALFMIAEAFAAVAAIARSAIIAADRYRLYAVITTIGCVGVLAACMVFIPRWGMIGGGVAFIVGYATMAGIGLVCIGRMLKGDGGLSFGVEAT